MCSVAVLCHGAQHAIHVCQQRLGSTCPAAGRCAVGIRPTVVLALKTCRLLESARGANGDRRRHTLHLVFGCPQLKQTSFARERTLDSATDLFQAAKKSVAWKTVFRRLNAFKCVVNSAGNIAWLGGCVHTVAVSVDDGELFVFLRSPSTWHSREEKNRTARDQSKTNKSTPHMNDPKRT